MNYQLLQALGLLDINYNPISQTKTIFAFKGDHGTGKTYIISLLCKYMKYKYQNTYVPFIRTKGPGQGPKLEVRFIFKLSHKKIGILSEGDQCNVLEKDLEYLIGTENCDTLICACSPCAPDTTTIIEKIAISNNYSYHFIDMQTIIKACPLNEKEIAAFEIAHIF